MLLIFFMWVIGACLKHFGKLANPVMAKIIGTSQE